MFNWCAPDARGYCTVAAPSALAVPGVSIRIPNGLSLAERAAPMPSASAVRSAAARWSGPTTRSATTSDFYSQRIDRSTGTVTDEFGNLADLAIVENTNDLKRRYSGVTVSATYRISATDRHRRQLHAVAAVGQLRRRERRQRAADLERSSSIRSIGRRPGTRRKAISAPISGTASTLWLNYGVPKINGLTLSVLQDLRQRPSVRRGRHDRRAIVRLARAVDRGLRDPAGSGERDVLLHGHETRSAPRRRGAPISRRTTASASAPARGRSTRSFRRRC